MDSVIENSIEPTADRAFQRIIYKAEIFAEEFTKKYFGDCYCSEDRKKTLKKAIKIFYVSYVGLEVDRIVLPQRIIDKVEIQAEEFTEKSFGDFICCEDMKETLKYVLKNYLSGRIYYRYGGHNERINFFFFG